MWVVIVGAHVEHASHMHERSDDQQSGSGPLPRQVLRKSSTPICNQILLDQTLSVPIYVLVVSIFVAYNRQDDHQDTADSESNV